MRQLSNRQLAAALAAALLLIVVAVLIRTTKAPENAVPPPQPVTATTPSQPGSSATPARDEKSTQILELFNPTDSVLTNQINETTLTQQIEQILSSSFVLTTCGLISSDDYRDSFRAVIIYAQRMKLEKDPKLAEAKARQIAQAASASYTLLYSRTKCNDPKLPENARQLLEWQRNYVPKEAE